MPIRAALPWLLLSKKRARRFNLIQYLLFLRLDGEAVCYNEDRRIPPRPTCEVLFPTAQRPLLREFQALHEFLLGVEFLFGIRSRWQARLQQRLRILYGVGGGQH